MTFNVATVLAFACVLGASAPMIGNADDRGAAARIQPYAKNPRYWQYQGAPIVLLGGSKDDNLFQIPDLEAHLKLLASVGGNYVRNVMSARDAGNVQPFVRLPDGRYDLERPNEEYWRRFEQLLRQAQALGIIVQIEVWDRFDYSRAHWETQPFNPKNNVNYTYEQSGFAATYPDHPARNMQPFFYTTPKQRNNVTVLRHQQRFVDELLRRALPYPNVLYCIDNETSAEEAWGAYWADYIRARARAAGVSVFITEMWDAWDLDSDQHRRTFDHPRRYDFVDVSQNNHQRGESHWRNFQWARAYLDNTPRPINTVKTYGADTNLNRTRLVGSTDWWRHLLNFPASRNSAHDYGTTHEGTARWWRHLIGGAAAVRFHRPPSGIGLSEEAQRHIGAARVFIEDFDLTRALPDATHARLAERRGDEAYLSRIGEQAYAVYFPDGGQVRLTVAPATYRVRWLDISAARWNKESRVRADDALQLDVPGDGHWLALINTSASVPTK